MIEDIIKNLIERKRIISEYELQELLYKLCNIYNTNMIDLTCDKFKEGPNVLYFDYNHKKLIARSKYFKYYEEYNIKEPVIFLNYIIISELYNDFYYKFVNEDTEIFKLIYRINIKYKNLFNYSLLPLYRKSTYTSYKEILEIFRKYSNLYDLDTLNSLNNYFNNILLNNYNLNKEFIETVNINYRDNLSNLIELINNLSLEDKLAYGFIINEEEKNKVFKKTI